MRRTALLLASCLALLAACDRAPTSPSTEAQPLAAPWSGGPHKVVTVMTRNLYLGADLNPVIGALTGQIQIPVPTAVAFTWSKVQASNFPARAGRLAREIVEADPELVGLQEVSLWRTGPVGNPAPAEAVAFDFLDLLLDSLAARGAAYEAVATSLNTDVEFPSATGVDVRMTDRDVIIAKRKLHTFNPQAGQYAARVEFPIAGTPLRVPAPRGWTSVDVKIRGESFRFFNTHLEVDGFAAVQEAQAREAVALLARTTLPVIAVGDFNSNGESGPAGNTLSYELLTAAGLMDTWPQVWPEDAGLTCCHDETLTNPVAAFYSRIDLVLTRGLPRAMAAWVVGEEPGDRTLSTPRLWPSDHAGVVAVVRLK